MKKSSMNVRIPLFNYGISSLLNSPGVNNAGALEDVLMAKHGGRKLKRKEGSIHLLSVSEINTPQPYSVFDLCKRYIYFQNN